ncbi:MAG TPA: hypothetical protein VGS16_10525 [Candidatus Dormibacteraeota bacterium]|nr:hypothetical protein [Candidatus Dormibacteraeota bacterium]
METRCLPASQRAPYLRSGDRPAQIGKHEVHEHDRGILPGGEDGRLVATPCDADDAQVFLVVQDPRDRRGKQRMVLDHKDPHLGDRDLIQGSGDRALSSRTGRDGTV